ncbi:MAG: FAD binding domain-containing protein [Bdellovibrionota bacterium]
MEPRSQIVFYLNGRRHEVGADQARLTLSDYLRYEKGLIGTKVVCAEGDCGACSVLGYSPLRRSQKPRGTATATPQYFPFNSCITLVAQIDGMSLVSVDALAEKTALSPVQNAMVKCHGSQCGFCTPGFVVALTGLVERKLCSRQGKPKQSSNLVAKIAPQEAKNALTGNLCRCTGYQPIIDAAVSIDLKECDLVAKRFHSVAQEKDLRKILSTPVAFESEAFSFFAPLSAREAARHARSRLRKKAKKQKPYRLAAAGTDLGVQRNKRKIILEDLISLHLVRELYEIKKKGASRISVGARVSLSELRAYVKTAIPEFARFLDLFASPQIKNIATLVGNVANASPIADTPPFLMVTNAAIQLVGPAGAREVPIDEFFLAYRKTALKPDELISSIDFEVPPPDQSLALYKVSQRKDLDISAVNAAFRVRWDAQTNVKEARIAMGGIAAIPLRLRKTEDALKNMQITPKTLALAARTLQSEIAPISDLRGSAEFRRVLAENLFLRFFDEHAKEARR